jgi:16S rRNA (adenine1518-N6/adenine1519-N6)-dimethyltransferase
MNPHKARKRFGQHFLVDHHLIDQIIESLDLQPAQRLIEIGPGLGALTIPLLGILRHLEVIELDRDLIAALRKMAPATQLTIYHQDVLTVTFEQGLAPLRLVGNLPYNISTPLVFHLLKQIALIHDMHFMFQKEVGLRLCAKPGDPQYGRLSVMTQYYCQNELLLDIPPEAFRPPPKVDSVFVRLKPYGSIPYIAHNQSLFADIVRQAFSQRRKTLRNSLSAYLKQSDFDDLALNPQVRPEQLSVERFVEISNFIFGNHQNTQCWH